MPNYEKQSPFYCPFRLSRPSRVGTKNHRARVLYYSHAKTASNRPQAHFAPCPRRLYRCPKSLEVVFWYWSFCHSYSPYYILLFTFPFGYVYTVLLVSQNKAYILVTFSLKSIDNAKNKSYNRQDIHTYVLEVIVCHVLIKKRNRRY